VNIWEYPYEEYIHNIATVFQDFSLFAFPIAENVAASKEYNGEKVYEALCRADLQKKIDPKIPVFYKQEYTFHTWNRLTIAIFCCKMS